MSDPWDFRDWIALGHVTSAGIVGTCYLFMHPETMNYATWAGLIATLSGVYHWLVVRDQKIPDAVPNTMYPGGDP